MGCVDGWVWRSVTPLSEALTRVHCSKRINSKEKTALAPNARLHHSILGAVGGIQGGSPAWRGAA